MSFYNVGIGAFQNSMMESHHYYHHYWELNQSKHKQKYFLIYITHQNRGKGWGGSHVFPCLFIYEEYLPLSTIK